MSEVATPTPKEILPPPKPWKEWLKDSVEKKGKEVKDASLENDDWRVVKNAEGKIQEVVHKDGLFFKLKGKDAGFKQPFMEPVHDPEDPKKRQGIVVMFVDRKTGDMLLNTEFETGSTAPKGVDIRPTIQHSYSNIRNNGYPFAEKFTANNIAEFDTRLKSMGGIIKNKQIDPGRIGNFNLYGILPVDRESVELANMPFHRWVTSIELKEMEAEENLLTAQFGTVNEIRLEWMMDQRLSPSPQGEAPVQIQQAHPPLQKAA